MTWVDCPVFKNTNLRQAICKTAWCFVCFYIPDVGKFLDRMLLNLFVFRMCHLLLVRKQLLNMFCGHYCMFQEVAIYSVSRESLHTRCLKNMKTVSSDFLRHAVYKRKKTSLPYRVTTKCPFFPQIQDINPYQSGGRHLLPFLNSVNRRCCI